MMFLQDCCVPGAIQMFMLELLGLLASSSTGVGSLSSCMPKEGTAEKTQVLFDFPLKQGRKDTATSNLVVESSLPKTKLAFPAPIIVHPLVGLTRVPDHCKLDLQT